jgi:DNA-binding MarR family transcriptional regulator
MNMTTQETESDAGLASELRISVTRLARRLRAERAAHGLPVLSELSDTQMGALGTLVAHGAMTPGELAEHEKVQPPSMTRVIAVLEQHGLVTRSAHATDKRQVMLTATDAGRNLVLQSRQVREAWLARRLAELTPQERAKLRAAAPILEKLSQS